MESKFNFNLNSSQLHTLSLHWMQISQVHNSADAVELTVASSPEENELYRICNGPARGPIALR